jgi:aminocarboxymuconate-semialdehyde decarboxylase
MTSASSRLIRASSISISVSGLCRFPASLSLPSPFGLVCFDRGYEAYPECQKNINKPPSEYLKSNFYYDTVNFDLKALQFAIDFAGVGHFVAGSDYPHLIGSMEKMVSSIYQLSITPTEKKRILGENAAWLLGLN